MGAGPGPGARVHFKRAIIATGSTPLPPPGGWPDTPAITDAAGILGLDKLPATLLVIGGSHAALELCSACAALGCTVSLVTDQPRLLPEADADLVSPLERSLGRQLDEISLSTTVTALRPTNGGVEVELVGRDQFVAPRPQDVGGARQPAVLAFSAQADQAGRRGLGATGGDDDLAQAHEPGGGEEPAEHPEGKRQPTISRPG